MGEEERELMIKLKSFFFFYLKSCFYQVKDYLLAAALIAAMCCSIFSQEGSEIMT